MIKKFDEFMSSMSEIPTNSKNDVKGGELETFKNDVREGDLVWVQQYAKLNQ